MLLAVATWLGQLLTCRLHFLLPIPLLKTGFAFSGCAWYGFFFHWITRARIVAVIRIRKNSGGEIWYNTKTSPESPAAWLWVEDSGLVICLA